MSTTAIHPPGLIELPGLTQAVTTTGTRTVYISGQVPAGPDGELSGETLGEQAATAFANLGRCLDAAGATFDDLVQMTIHVVGYRPEQFDELFGGALSGMGRTEPPATSSTLVGIDSLFIPGQLIEVSAIAVVD